MIYIFFISYIFFTNRTGGSLVTKTKQLNRIVLQNLGPHLRLDVKRLKITQPPLRGQQRIVGAEQDLVLKERVGGPDKLRREVLRRPSGQVDERVGLVRGDRDRGRRPRHRWVGEDDLELGEVGRHVVDQHRVRQPELDAAPARQPGP